MSEKLHEELSRLIDAYENSSFRNRIEAWNMIADLVVENRRAIVGALRSVDEDERYGRV